MAEMKYVTLQIREDEVTGESGFCLLEMSCFDEYPMVDTGDGIQIAHDLIEHQNGAREIGSIHDELQAIGAAWYTRGQYGFFQRNSLGYQSPQQSLAGDLTRQAEAIYGGTWFNETPPPATRESYYDQDLQEVVNIGAHDFFKYMADEGDGDKESVEYYFKVAFDWMRLGVRKAERRFRSSRKAHQTFWQIADAIKRGLYEFYEGDRYLLGYSQYKATLRPLHEEDIW